MSVNHYRPKTKVELASVKILCISDAWLPQVNGVVRTYQALQRELARQGHELSVIGPAEFPFTLPLPGYPEIRLAFFSRSRLAEKIRTFDPDALHIATEGPLGRAARDYCLRHGIKFTTCYHTQFPDYIGLRIARYAPALRGIVTKFVTALLRRFHAPAARLLVVTPSLKARLMAQGYAPPVACFSRGVDTSLFRPALPDEKEHSAFAGLKKPVALCVGRIAIEKTLENFLETPWAGSKVVVGDGPELVRLRHAYPDVIFLGARMGEDLAACYRAADIFVFPSKTDTFGLVLIEALASGLPVAAYRVPGPLDIIDRPLLGALDDDLGAAMQTALKTSGTPGDRARHVAATYTWEAAAGQFLAGLVSTRQAL
jgi:glycosyltransferase involved in cell wall biosynthesis